MKRESYGRPLLPVSHCQVSTPWGFGYFKKIIKYKFSVLHYLNFIPNRLHLPYIVFISVCLFNKRPQMDTK